MTVRVRLVDSISHVPGKEWDTCASAVGGPYNPFVSHAFLSALEQSGSATVKTGWDARHIVLEEEGVIAGVAACYLKSHSQGEYVFDHGWAEAFHRAGGRYYPKFQLCAPFTPVTGPRLLAGKTEHRKLMAQAAAASCSAHDASSVHMTFLPEAQVDELAGELYGGTWLRRRDIQFHWHNDNYATYEDFLGSLASAKRKNLRKERQSVRDAGIEFELLSGKDLTETHWDHFFAFYMDTGSRKWGHPYLTRQFFSLIGEQMAKDVLLVMAKRNGHYIAGALNFIGGDTLYGRNWGCIEHHPCLHFETCYYQAQEFAIARGLKVVEAGAQGEHKLARGYVPIATHSLHHVEHAGLRRAIADYLMNETRAMSREQNLMAEHTPFKTVGKTGT